MNTKNKNFIIYFLLMANVFLLYNFNKNNIQDLNSISLALGKKTPSVFAEIDKSSVNINNKLILLFEKQTCGICISFLSNLIKDVNRKIQENIVILVRNEDTLFYKSLKQRFDSISIILIKKDSKLSKSQIFLVDEETNVLYRNIIDPRRLGEISRLFNLLKAFTTY